jgi:hypothetical protein
VKTYLIRVTKNLTLSLYLEKDKRANFMKRIIFSTSAICISLFLITIYSCNKTSTKFIAETETSKKTRSGIETINYNGVSYLIENGMLVVNSFNDYKVLFDDEEGQGTEELFANAIDNSNNLVTFYDTYIGEDKEDYDFTGKIVNQAGFIKIGGYLMLIDLLNNKVYTKENGTIAELTAAKAGNVASDVLVYGTEDDVIENLESSNKKKGCKDKWAYQDHDGYSIESTGVCQINTNPLDPSAGVINGASSFSAGCGYKHNGIYFRIQAIGQVDPIGASTANEPFDLTTNMTCKRRCGKSFIRDKSTDAPLGTFNNGQCKVVHKMYGGFKSITTFWIQTKLTSPTTLIPGNFILAIAQD